MTPSRPLLVLSAALIATLAGAGCATESRNSSDSRSGSGARQSKGQTKEQNSPIPPPRVANKENAADILRQAEEAERNGDTSRAMESYERLRSFPEASKPKNLEERIERLRKDMTKTPPAR